MKMQKLPIQGVLCGVDAFTRHIIAGPCYQVAAVVDSLLCGLVGKTVARQEENCKRLVGAEFDRTGVESVWV